MVRSVLLLCLLAGCQSAPPPETYGFIARLGRDTVSVESISRQGDTLISDEVDRFPRVRRRHARIVLNPDGGIKRVEMDINTPSEPSNQRDRHVVADVTTDSVRITKRDSSGGRFIAFATGGARTMAHLPQMYSLIELYFAAALKGLAVGDSATLRQFYLDREFDRFPLHQGVVKSLAPNRAEIHHDWLSGFGEATLDSAHHMLAYSGARSTYKVDVERLKNAPDVKAIGERFAAAETADGMKQLSVRDTTRARIGSVTLMVDYGRPLARGRVLLGNVLPYDRVWRTGANAATQFTTSGPITLAGMQMPAGTYTLWTVPRDDGRAELIVNKQFGQWGTEYNGSLDVGMKPLTTESGNKPVEKFTISIVPGDAHTGTLVLEWGTFRWTAPIIIGRTTSYAPAVRTTNSSSR